jgi:hypothetical protein
MLRNLLYLAVLFFVLTPGILLTLPKGGSKIVVAATHAVVFATVWYFTRRFVVEKFQDDDEDYEETREGFLKGCKDKNGKNVQCVCFPASAIVTVDDGSDSGKKTRMSDLNIGDKVLSVESSTGKVSYSDVYAHGHRDSESTGNYYALTTASGKSLQISPEHYMHVSEHGCSGSIASATTLSAKFVKLGMGAWIHSSEGMTCSPIVDIRESEEKGLYNSFTLNGNMLVDDVYASCYVPHSHVPIESFLSTLMNAENVARSAPALWHTLFAPLRALYLANGPEWATRVSNAHAAEGWKDLSLSSLASTMIKESFVTA